VTLIRHEAIPSHGMGPATMGRKHRALHTEGLPKSASETTTRKIKQADEPHRMGTRTKSLRTISKALPLRQDGSVHGRALALHCGCTLPQLRWLVGSISPRGARHFKCEEGWICTAVSSSPADADAVPMSAELLHGRCTFPGTSLFPASCT